MSRIEEFIEARVNIETLVRQVTLCVERKAVQDSRRYLDEASTRLEVLKAMVANDVQVIVAGRLSRQLADLEPKVEKLAAKRVRKIVVEKKLKTSVRPDGYGNEFLAG
jgi:hypothetical protein